MVIICVTRISNIDRNRLSIVARCDRSDPTCGVWLYVPLFYLGMSKTGKHAVLENPKFASDTRSVNERDVWGSVVTSDTSSPAKRPPVTAGAAGHKTTTQKLTSGLCRCGGLSPQVHSSPQRREDTLPHESDHSDQKNARGLLSDWTPKEPVRQDAQEQSRSPTTADQRS